jgi:hypothetical protein
LPGAVSKESCEIGRGTSELESVVFQKRRRRPNGRGPRGFAAALEAALSASSATLPSAEERRAEAVMAESLAASGAGAVEKTTVGVAGRLRRQWLRWLTEHGEAYEYDAAVRIL